MTHLFKKIIHLVGWYLLVSQAFASTPPEYIRPSLQSKISFEPALILTSNYIWRGISQTDNGPAMQGDLKVKSDIGLYAGAFGSNVDFTGSDGKKVSSEFQCYAGFKNERYPVIYDLGLMEYLYPNASGPNFTEAYVNLTYQILTLGVYRSNEVPNLYGHGTYHGTYLTSILNYPIPTFVFWGNQIERMSVGAHIGRYLFSQKNPRDSDYTDYKLSVDKKFKWFAVEFAWTDTNGGAHLPSLDNSKWVLSLIVSDFSG